MSELGSVSEEHRELFPARWLSAAPRPDWCLWGLQQRSRFSPAASLPPTSSLGSGQLRPLTRCDKRDLTVTEGALGLGHSDQSCFAVPCHEMLCVAA